MDEKQVGLPCSKGRNWINCGPPGSILKPTSFNIFINSTEVSVSQWRRHRGNLSTSSRARAAMWKMPIVWKNGKQNTVSFNRCKSWYSLRAEGKGEDLTPFTTVHWGMHRVDTPFPFLAVLDLVHLGEQLVLLPRRARCWLRFKLSRSTTWLQLVPPNLYSLITMWNEQMFYFSGLYPDPPLCPPFIKT